MADDSEQRKPSRPYMRHLVAAGGLHVPGSAVGSLERELHELCEEFEFPAGEEFKWSPGRRDWMRNNLTEDDRSEFFRNALELARGHDVAAVVVIADSKSGRAISSSKDAEEDVVAMLLERVQNQCRSTGVDALVVADRPGGDRKSETRFLSDCLDTLRVGTTFVQFDRLALLLTADSKMSRLLQLADVVTSCTVNFVAGEDRFSPQTFAAIKPLLRRDSGRVGGVGVKIHPDLRYGNLYYWLLEDTHLVRQWTGIPLPERGKPYFNSATDPNLM